MDFTYLNFESSLNHDDTQNIEFSIIVPVYNSEYTLIELSERLKTTLKKLTESFEIILIDDFSHDNSWNVMKFLHRDDNRIKIIQLQKNFGQHNATLCGFNYASGTYIITLDDDLQHPPEEITKLIKHIQNGFDVVYGKYEPKNSNLIQNIMSKAFQRTIHKILNFPDTVFFSSFAIYKKPVVKNMIIIKNSFPFIFGLVAQSTSSKNIGNVNVNHFGRKTGQSNYGFIRYIVYSLNLLINYSSWPLLIISYIGFIFSIISVLYGLTIVIHKIIDPTYGIIGWNSLMVAITFIGGLLLLSMGVIGEYLRRILIESSYGQQFVIREMIF